MSAARRVALVTGGAQNTDDTRAVDGGRMMR